MIKTEETIQKLEQIINELQWGIERNREIRLSKHDYRIILLVIEGYLKLREEIYKDKEVVKSKLK